MIELELSATVWCARAELAAELAEADWRVRTLVLLLAELARPHGLGVCVTSVDRDVAATRAIYLAGGKRAPAGPGVHDVRPTRGVDAKPVPLNGAHAHIDLDRVGETIAARMRELAVYPRGKPSCLWHDVGNGRHWHVQVSSEALAIHADPRRPESTAWGEGGTA